MSIHAQALVEILEGMAPKRWAADWDNVGLLVGALEKTVDRVLLTLDVTAAVVQEAIDKQCQMIIAHHPIIFRPLKTLRTDLYQGKLLGQLIKKDITVYAAHTNLDVAPQGVNAVLAEKLGLVDLCPLQSVGHDQLFKLVVFVPTDYTEAVRQALGAAGAGHLGNYSHCSFTATGRGTFLPLPAAQPFRGQSGRWENVAEDRLEVIVQEAQVPRVLRAMQKAHPYEEIAYDLIPLANKELERSLGLIGTLPQPLRLQQLADRIKQELPVSVLRYAGDETAVVKKVAVCGGSGGDLVYRAANRADVLVTGDVSYHQALDAQNLGLHILDAGHFATEWPVLLSLQELLLSQAKRDAVEVVISQANADVWSLFSKQCH